ncbi:expansin [Pseudozyma hubeiensis SY62]|uniref:Expansin n=1 Tax=Pseudozyma hubeiensis (strain SY62) TaxID=1305764 RepID=R9PI08_PSEHS|nr:expansin [Pseudozyma hubeiensis SY62]GAC97735.1 expansin [Pseudozyma hubeiensis SY62]
MQFFRLATFVVTMLVMVTFTTPFAHTHPVHSVQYARGLFPPNRHRGLVHHVPRFYRADSDIFKANRVVPLMIRDAGDDHGDVAAHDRYEAQLHKLEAALKHYEEYGDAESLQFYLKGFGGEDGDAGEAQKNPAQSSVSGKETAAKKQDDGKKEQVQQQQPQQQQPEQKPKQPQQIDSEDCVDGVDGSESSKKHDSSASPQMQQHAQSSRPPPPPAQPQKMVKKPKPQQQQQPSGDYSVPSDPPQPQPQHDQPKPPQPAPAPAPAPKQPSPPPSSPSSSDNSINGYTPPTFNPPAGSPSTASLYTSSTPFTGRATFYNTGLGACGITNTDDQPIVAISRDLFEQYNPASGNPNHNSLCGKKVEITWNGKKVQAFATDECPGCEKNSLDCSPSVFERMDSKDKGVLDGITWRFV